MLRQPFVFQPAVRVVAVAPAVNVNVVTAVTTPSN